MKKLSLVLVLSIILESLCLMGVPAFAADVALEGDGTEGSPYLIDSYDELVAFRDKVNGGETSAYATLMEDIALSGNWIAIGTAENKYSGSFDGNSHMITNIKGAGSNSAAWGLFAYTNGGEIKNLTVSTGSDAETAIGHQAALIVGIASNGTKITKCAGLGNISGWGYIGGITYDGDCIVTDSYYVGNIKGAHNVTAMGLKAAVTNCYAYSNITADTHAFKLTNKSATNSYFLYAEGAQGTGGYGTQKSAEAFTSGEVAYLLGESFGQTIGVDKYPVFKTEDNTVYKNSLGGYSNSETEEGSVEKPYTIANTAALNAFRNLVNAGNVNINAKLTANIDLKNASWTPIGTSANKFAGTFDGNGFKISGINGAGTQWGFCSYTNGGEIKNLTIEAGNNGSIKAGHQSAFFVGVASNDTKITNCAGIGNISVNDGFVGGITSDGACIVTDCYFVGDVTGVNRATAMGYDAKAYNCFAYGNITATKEGNGYAFKISNNKATTNCYYLASSGVSGTGGYGTQKSAEAFTSGEVAYLLGAGFGQRFGEDEYPVFKTDDNEVYFKDDICYTNDNMENGTTENPYTIDSYIELNNFRTAVNNGKTSISGKLMADINISSANWTAIGTSANKYDGTFDGNGFEISGIKGTGNNNAAWGLFAYTNGGEIKNLTVSTGSDAETAIGHQAALIVGIASNGTKITKCVGLGNVSGWGYIGGITYDGDCIVTDSYYIGDIKGAHNVTAMGLKATVTNCYAYSNITADTHAFRMTGKSATNSYFLYAEGAEGTGGYGTQKSAEAFASGEVAYLINKGAGEIIYGQDVTADAYPTTEKDTIVYKKIDGTYSNSEGAFVSLNGSEAVIIAATDAIAFIAQYGDAETLKTANPVTLKAGVAYETEITPADGAANAKIFVWDLATSLNPIAEAEGYTFN